MKTTMAAALGDSELMHAFQTPVEYMYALVSKFSEIWKLKPVQEEALMEFIQQKDVFAVLPTGNRPKTTPTGL